MVIGLSGVAGCGKDTFFSVLSESMNVKRISLADSLKEEANDWTLRHYGIDSMTCSRKDKEKIRPFLVYHGGMKRDRSNGRHWIELASKRIARNHPDCTTVITDIRFDEYENDEVSWLQNELGGKLIHLKLWRGVSDPNEGVLYRKYKEAANSAEAKNDPKLIAKADYKIEIRQAEGGSIEDIKASIHPKVQKFIKWIKDA